MLVHVLDALWFVFCPCICVLAVCSRCLCICSPVACASARACGLLVSLFVCALVLAVHSALLPVCLLSGGGVLCCLCMRLTRCGLFPVPVYVFLRFGLLCCCLCIRFAAVVCSVIRASYSGSILFALLPESLLSLLSRDLCASPASEVVVSCCCLACGAVVVVCWLCCGLQPSLRLLHPSLAKLSCS